MTGMVHTGRLADALVRDRDRNFGSSGGFDHNEHSRGDYRPTSAVATGSFGAVSPPLSG